MEEVNRKGSEANQAAVDELNQRYGPVRFTYQQTAENIQINLNADNGTMTLDTNPKEPSVGYNRMCILYIDVNG